MVQPSFYELCASGSPLFLTPCRYGSKGVCGDCGSGFDDHLVEQRNRKENSGGCAPFAIVHAGKPDRVSNRIFISPVGNVSHAGDYLSVQQGDLQCGNDRPDMQSAA